MSINPPTLNDRLRLLESCVRGIILELDGDGRYLEVWTHDPSLLARPRNELIGTTITDVFGEQGARRFLGMIREILSTRQPVRLEYSLDVLGGFRWFVADGFLGERPGTVIMLIQDITEQKRMEARMLESDRLAAIGLLAGGVGHEINNPLAWVMNELSALRSEVQTTDVELMRRWAPRLDRALEGIDRIRVIVRHLSFFSRTPETDSVVVQLPRPLEWACEMVSAELRHRARCTRVFGPAPAVLAPETRLGQVFLNLLINSAQSIPEGNVEGNEVRVELGTDDAGNARVDIVDSGLGVPVEHQPRLFEPFFTTKPRGTGTGLGLAVSRRLVESLGGSVTLVSSRPGETRFRVTLPAAGPQRGEAAVKSASELPPTSLRVLVVDDHPGFLVSLAKALEASVQVTAESSGRDALARLEAGEPFDAIVCDVMMPDVSGIEVYEAVAAHRPQLLPRLVLMTGGAYTDRAREFLRTVAAPRIEKPFQPEQLLALLASVARSRAD